MLIYFKCSFGISYSVFCICQGSSHVLLTMTLLGSLELDMSLCGVSPDTLGLRNSRFLGLSAKKLITYNVFCLLFCLRKQSACIFSIENHGLLKAVLQLLSASSTHFRKTQEEKFGAVAK